MKIVDMHVHSRFSDGLLTVQEIAERAVSLGIGGFALTDHDTFDGIDETAAHLKALKSDLLFIPGCEFSTYFDIVGEIHILAYFTSPSYSGLKDLVRQFKENRVTRARKMIELLAKNGYKLDAEAIIGNGGKPVGRMHIARALVEKGYFVDTNQAFERMLRNGTPCYIARKEIKTGDAIKAIRDSGGMAVLAHPTILYQMKNWELLKTFVSYGLNGIESRHPKISQELTGKIESYEPEKLIFTGGSDFHGDNAQEKIGKYGMDYQIALNHFRQLPKI